MPSILHRSLARLVRRPAIQESQTAAPVHAPKPKKIKLALQGGGAHGAFTWGVLDRLLEDDRLEFSAISGTSAGAMNAVVMAAGMHQGGREGAKTALAKFWRDISIDGQIDAAMPRAIEGLFSAWSAFMPTAAQLPFFNVMQRFTSPYDFNPLDINPLRDAVEELVDFDAVRACEGLEVFVSATDVHTGKIKLFTDGELSVDSVMASACLPLLFKAVEIDGRTYWDGGYSGNPALFPLYGNGQSCDIVLVQINPIERDETPTTPQEIMERVNEITFNASLLRELRAIEFVNRLASEGRLDSKYHAVQRLHRIGGTAEMEAFTSTSKMDTRFAFLEKLRDIGRRSAEAFLTEHYHAIGHHGTLDLKEAIQ